MSAVTESSAPVASSPPQPRSAICEVLLRYGVDFPSANAAAANELQYWSLPSIDSIFRQVELPAEYPPLALRPSDDRDISLFTLFSFQPRNLRAPTHLVRRSATERNALCVNAAGQWSLRSSGYIALSHVWKEGIRGGPEGFNRFQLSRIIETLKKAGLEMEWLWIDVLAIPSGSGSADDDELKVTIINNLADIYKQADAVLILDALLLRMSPRTLTDVAVGLVCGNWITRIWTYQEVKLASRALIVTSSRTVELAAVVSELELLASSQPLLFEQLLKSICRLMRYDALGVSIKDIAMSCGERETGNEIDYVRAFFPVLGLKWNVRWGPEDGMKAIYSSRWMQAGSMVLLHGRKRMTSAPAWAPFRLTGLEGNIIGGMA